MVVEQETQSLILFGFSIVLVFVILSIFLAWRKTKNRGLIWFIPQLIMLVICLHLFLKLINHQNTVPTVMLSEENSLSIGLMVISWALSMVFMTVGIISTIKNKTAKNKIDEKAF